MTAKSHRRRRKPVQLASMETLGFFDTPGTATSGPHAKKAVPSAAATQTAVANGGTVQDLWESTELDSETLRGWKPRPTSPRLNNRNFRWSVILIGGVLLGVTSAAGYWIYQRPTNAAEVAAVEVSARASALTTALEALAPFTQGLEAGENPNETDMADAILAVNQAARDLFSASANLPASESESRSIAADASSLSLDASRHLNDISAYRAALEPNLTVPALETDSSLVDLTAAAQDFGDWRARLTRVREALPSGVAVAVTGSFDRFLASLERVQSAYLDALRSETRFGAADVVDEIEAELTTIQSLLDAAMIEAAERVSRQIDDAKRKLALLVG